MQKKQDKKLLIDISTLTLIKVLLIILVVFFLFFIKDILLLIFVALLISAALDPAVDWMQKYKIPRSAGLLFIYLGIFSILALSIYLIIPPIFLETSDLAKNFPAYWNKASGIFANFQSYSSNLGLDKNIQETLNAIESSLGGMAGGLFNIVGSFFGGIVSFFIIIVMAFYLAADEQSMKRTVRSVVPVSYQPYVTNLINRIQTKIGWWLRGQLVLSLIIFLMSWIGLSILGVKYALVLALFAGITELIPYLGPFIGALPAVFIAFTQDPTLALWVIGLYIIIQQAENHLIVPKVMQKAVGLSPVVVIIAILIGAKIAGILGVLMAVPVATAMSVFIGDFMNNDSEKN